MQTPANRFKAALAEGRTLQGAWSMCGSPTVVEALGFVGADYVVIDLEHSPTPIHGVLPLLHAAEASGTMAVVRMSDHSRTSIKHALDLGANTLMFPFVESAGEAEAIVDACLYPPHGRRGVSRMHRASRYVAYEDYGERAVDDVLIIPQLESEAAIRNTEAIAGAKGVGAVFVGPGDLAASLGLMGQLGHERVRALMAEAARRAGAVGKPCGTVMGDAESAVWAMDAGYRFVSVSNDLAALLGAARAQQSQLRRLRGG